MGRSPTPLHWHALVVALGIALLGVLYDAVNPGLEYNRAAISNGELWRLVTGHWVHSNLWHLAGNLSLFVLCAVYFGAWLTPARLWLWLLCCTLLISAVFWVRDPGLAYYVGLSGALHGLLVMGLIATWSQCRTLHSLALVVVMARLAWEQTPAYDPYYLFDFIRSPVYANAHLYGAAVGAALGVGLCWRDAKVRTLCQGIAH